MFYHHEDEAESDDLCPVCEESYGTCGHLLACFDLSAEHGDFGVGLVDGALRDVEEIDWFRKVFLADAAKAILANGNAPKRPDWCAASQVGELWTALVVEPKWEAESSLDELVDDLRVSSHAAWRLFLSEILDHGFGTTGSSTSYECWWNGDPQHDVEVLRKALRGLLADRPVPDQSE